MLSRTLSLAITAIVGSCLIATAAAAQSTVLVLHSEPGEYIGGGRNTGYSPLEGTFAAQRNFDNGVSLSYQDFPDNWWYLDFAAPDGAFLAPGTYEMATRFPFQAAGAPGLSVSGNGAGCNESVGRFTVIEIVYGPGTSITRFSANFEQHCDGQLPALFGSIRFNASPTATRNVTVAANGTGSGTITSYPTGVQCGTTCVASLAADAITVLVPTPAPDSGFTGWSGPADCSDGVLTDGGDVTCTANFVTCGYAIDPASAAGTFDGGSGQIAVTAATGCRWTPVSSAPEWLFTPRGENAGSQSLEYNYGHRGPHSGPRSATLTIGDQVFTLTQPGTPFSASVWPPSEQTGPAATALDVPVWISVNDVPWTTSSNAPWLTVQGGGTGSQSVRVSVARNPGTTPRTGTVTLAGVVVAITQRGNGVPGEPRDFTASVAGHLGQFAWLPPNSNGDATSYRLEAGSTPGTTMLALPLAGPISHQLPGVPSGRFFVRLRGVNEFGVGPATEDVELLVGPTGVSAPLPPNFLNAYIANRRLTVSWSDVPGATAYVLEAGGITGRTDLSLPMGSATYTTIENVPLGAYFLRVRALNAGGASPPSVEQLIVSGNGPAAPYTPNDLRVEVSGSTVTLRWSSYYGGVAPTRYRLEAGAYRGATSLTFDTALATTTLGFSGVPPGRYFLRLRGVNAHGAGPATRDIRIDVR